MMNAKHAGVARAAALMVLCCGAAIPAWGRGPEDKKQTGLVMQPVAGTFKKDYVTFTKILEIMSANLTDAQQVNIFGMGCASGGLIKAVTDKAPTFSYAVSAACEFDDETTSGSSNVDKPVGRLKIANVYRFGFTAYLAKALGGPAPSFNGLHKAAADDYDADPALANASNNGKHPTKIAATADSALKLNAGTKGNHVVEFVGDQSGGLFDPPMYSTLYANMKTSLTPTTSQYYLANEGKGGPRDGDATRANFIASMALLKPKLEADKAKQVVSVFLGGHGFYDTVDVSLAPGGIDGMAKQGVVLAAATNTLDVQMGSVEWAMMGMLPEGSGDVYPQRWQSPEVFVTFSEGEFNAPVGLWVNDLFLGDYIVDPAENELRVALSDAQILQLITNYGGASALNIRFDLSGGSWFRLGTDGDVSSDGDYAAGYAGTGISFFGSEVPAPGAAVIGVAALWIGRRRRDGR